MRFVLAEVMFTDKNRIASIPVLLSDLFNICYTFDSSENVIAFKVNDDGGYVSPDHFGYGVFNKWVTKFCW